MSDVSTPSGAKNAPQSGDVSGAVVPESDGVEPMDDYDDYENEEEFDDDMDRFDCGLDDEGQCSLAGTEDCDFECPYRDSEDFCGSAAWYCKRGETPPWETPTSDHQETPAPASSPVPEVTGA